MDGRALKIGTYLKRLWNPQCSPLFSEIHQIKISVLYPVGSVFCDQSFIVFFLTGGNADMLYNPNEPMVYRIFAQHWQQTVIGMPFAGLANPKPSQSNEIPLHWPGELNVTVLWLASMTRRFITSTLELSTCVDGFATELLINCSTKVLYTTTAPPSTQCYRPRHYKINRSCAVVCWIGPRWSCWGYRV